MTDARQIKGISGFLIQKNIYNPITGKIGINRQEKRVFDLGYLRYLGTSLPLKDRTKNEKRKSSFFGCL